VREGPLEQIDERELDGLGDAIRIAGMRRGGQFVVAGAPACAAANVDALRHESYITWNLVTPIPRNVSA
jgi:hypothetical protein